MCFVILAVVLVAISPWVGRYPIKVCSCSEIHNSNHYDIYLVDISENLVTLAPAVKLVKTISREAVILSNLKSQELIENPSSSGHRYWEVRGSLKEEGYYLHQCDSTPQLTPLGMDREKAIAWALELVEKDKKDPKSAKGNEVKGEQKPKHEPRGGT